MCAVRIAKGDQGIGLLGQPFDWLGMAVLAVLLTSLAYGLNQLDTENLAASIASPEVWGFLLLAVLLVPVFVLVERRAVDPVLDLRIFGSRQLRLANIFSALAGLAEAAVVFVPTLLVLAFAVDEWVATAMLLPIVLVMAIGSPLAGRGLDRAGSRTVVLFGTGLLSIGLLMVGLLPITLVGFYVSAGLVGLGLASLLGAPLRYITLNEAPRSERAAAQGALALSTRVGQLLGGAVVGAVAASQGGGPEGYQSAFLVVGLLALACFAAAFTLKGRTAEMETVQRNEAAAVAAEV